MILYIGTIVNIYLCIHLTMTNYCKSAKQRQTGTILVEENTYWVWCLEINTKNVEPLYYLGLRALGRGLVRVLCSWLNTCTVYIV